MHSLACIHRAFTLLFFGFFSTFVRAFERNENFLTQIFLSPLLFIITLPCIPNANMLLLLCIPHAFWFSHCRFAECNQFVFHFARRWKLSCRSFGMRCGWVCGEWRGGSKDPLSLPTPALCMYPPLLVLFLCFSLPSPPPFMHAHLHAYRVRLSKSYFFLRC